MSFSQVCIAQYVCPTIPATMGPDPIPSIPTQYETRVEINIDNDQKTREMRLFYDYDLRKAAVIFKKDNKYEKLIFNYDTNEIYELKYDIGVPSDILTYPPDERPEFPTTCETHIITDSPVLSDLFGYQRAITIGSMLLPATSNQAFKFYPQGWVGLDEARGIPSDVYLSCQYDSVLKTNFSVKHYFSRPEFNLAGSSDIFKRLPVRAVYSGLYKGQDGFFKDFSDTHD